MRVACIQLSSGENYNKNIQQIIKLILQAIKKKSDLIITPETSSLITSNKELLYNYSFSMPKDPLIVEVKKISKKYKKWILIGSLPIKDKKKYRNRSIMIGPKGNIINYYDKIKMFDVKLPNKEKHQESKTFIPGKKLVTINLPWGKLGLTICFDLRFPEIYRNLSKKKLHFISVPSAFTKITGQKHWLPLLKARAIENFSYIFAPNQVGKNTKKRETFGHSVIISPDGKILKLKKKGVGNIYADINPNLSIQLRKIIPSLN
tara:strand:- start:384 stop:1169 length:786 start_codon:yes stop_codon:yes gene_type:complete